jgi:hypothetical protein
MSANIVLSLSATKLEVAPGESVEATITIRNQSQIVDQFGIRIQGLDPTWWTLSTSSVSLFPGDQGEAKLTIHPPKEAESKAGSYSFQVRAVSQANAEEMTEEEAYLILRGFLVWDVEMSPTKVVGRSGTYRLTASNSGNTDITLILEGKDPEEALDYTFSHNKVTVPAGESALITLKVNPKKKERGKLYNFQVLVRPAEAKVSSKEAKTIDGQFEYQRRWPWKWILLGIAVAAAVFLVWKFLIPASLPVINSFTTDPEIIAVGESSTLSWDVTGATTVTIDQEVEGVDLDPTAGTYTVSPTTTTNYTLKASNKAGNITDTVQVRVLPVINSFTVDLESITVGEDSTLSWDVSGATTVTMYSGEEPSVVILPNHTGTRIVSPTTTITYTLEANNEAGSVTDTVQIKVLPAINSFTANPKNIYYGGGTSTLSWDISGATTVTIDHGVGIVTPTTGSTDVYLYTSTSTSRTYTLVATNDAGSSTATVTVTAYEGSPPLIPIIPIEPIFPYP